MIMLRPISTLFPYTTLFRSDPKAASFDYRKYATPYTHAGEVGEAGYYRVHLLDARARDGGIDVEATALTRAAAERYTFAPGADRKSTRLNSSHPSISYAVFC